MKDKKENNGIQLLIRQYKKQFETEENINYYSYKDFIKAERKYIKFALNGTISSGQRP